MMDLMRRIKIKEVELVVNGCNEMFAQPSGIVGLKAASSLHKIRTAAGEII